MCNCYYNVEQFDTNENRMCNLRTYHENKFVSTMHIKIRMEVICIDCEIAQTRVICSTQTCSNVIAILLQYC